MRESAAAVRLQSKANLIIDTDGDERRGTVRRCDHAQAVGKRGVLNRNVKTLQRYVQLVPPLEFASARLSLPISVAGCFERMRTARSARIAYACRTSRGYDLSAFVCLATIA